MIQKRRLKVGAFHAATSFVKVSDTVIIGFVQWDCSEVPNLICNVILGTFEKRLGEKHVIPLERLRVAAVGGFLTQPVLSNPDLIDDVSAALHHATTINALNESMLRFAVGGEDIDEKKAQVAEMIRELAKVTARIDSRVWTLMAGLGPLVGP